MLSGLACQRELLRTKGIPALSCSAPERMLDYDFRSFTDATAEDARPPVSIPAVSLNELLGLARSRVVITSAQDFNTAAVQVAALSMLRQMERLHIPRSLRATLSDLLKMLTASDVLWSEGMKLDSVMLANLSLIQRDSYLAMCPQLSTQVASLWRAQPFLSERVFGMDDAAKRDDLHVPAPVEMRLHLSEQEFHPLEMADRILLASELRFLPLEDAPPSED